MLWGFLFKEKSSGSTDSNERFDTWHATNDSFDLWVFDLQQFYTCGLYKPGLAIVCFKFIQSFNIFWLSIVYI